jgi:AraC-like DNA-binding protein/quercetin dioxygenase-like cupin family protein
MRKEQSNTEEKTRGVIMNKNDMTEEYVKELDSQKSLTVHIGETPYKIFFSYSFYYHRNDFSTFHSHSSYHEVIIIDGDCDFIVDDEVLKLKGTNVITMPPKVYHKLLTTENVESCAFFIDKEIDFSVKQIPTEIVRAFFKESEGAYETGDHSKVSGYLSLILSYCFPSSAIEPELVSDYGFLIDKFFNGHYTEDVSLETLAEFLHVSVTHAHRLLQKHTGVTFTEELTVRRLKVADYLTKHRGMNLTEAAEAVGFRNYTAFWKARAKYKEKS